MIDHWKSKHPEFDDVADCIGVSEVTMPFAKYMGIIAHLGYVMFEFK